MGLRRTVYIASNPQEGAQKRKVTALYTKVDLSERKSTTKFLCAKNFSAFR